MSFLSGLTGNAGISDPVTQDQINQSLGTANSGLSQQQSFINALNGANGVGNQSSVFAQQQQLANQLQAQANGQGPNPAQTMLAQQTGNNVANQASLMAGQRGAGANVGLMARQAAQQDAATQQQAVGEAATLGAQQQLGAQQNLMQQQSSMGNLASAQVGQQAAALNAYTGNATNLYGQQLGAQANYNNAANTQFQNQTEAGGKLMGALGSVAAAGLTGGASLMAPAVMGAVAHKYTGGTIHAPVSNAGRFLKHGATPMKSGGAVPGQAQVKGNSPKNDTVPAVLSPGEFVIPRSLMNSKDPKDQAAIKHLKSKVGNK